MHLEYFACYFSHYLAFFFRFITFPPNVNGLAINKRKVKVRKCYKYIIFVENNGNFQLNATNSSIARSHWKEEKPM